MKGIRRPNRVAQGFTDHEERRKEKGRSRISNPAHPLYDHDLSRLIVFGTTDELAKGVNYMTTRVMKPHPVDMGYFKEVYVLSKYGKAKLKRMRYDAAKSAQSGTTVKGPKIP